MNEPNSYDDYLRAKGERTVDYYMALKIVNAKSGKFVEINPPNGLSIAQYVDYLKKQFPEIFNRKAQPMFKFGNLDDANKKLNEAVDKVLKEDSERQGVRAKGLMPVASKRVKSDGYATDYYDLPEDATTLNDLIEYRQMPFAIGNIFKACYRMGQKDGIDELYDLNKILYFAEQRKAWVLKRRGQ